MVVIHTQQKNVVHNYNGELKKFLKDSNPLSYLIDKSYVENITFKIIKYEYIILLITKKYI